MPGNSGEILVKLFRSIGKMVAGSVTGVEVSDGVDFVLAPITMTRNEDKPADRLIRISETLNENLEMLSLWHDTLRLTGLNADNVLAEFKNTSIEAGGFSINNALRRTGESTRRESTPDAIRQGGLLRYGEDAAEFLAQGSDAMRKVFVETKDNGYGQPEQALKALQKAYPRSETREQRTARSRAVWSPELAVSVGDAFDLINGAIAKNEEKHNEWTKTAGKVAGGGARFFEGFTGVVPEPGADAEARLNSDDPEIRDQIIHDRRNAELLRDLGGSVRMEGAHDYANPMKYLPKEIPMIAIDNATDRIPPTYYNGLGHAGFGMLNSLEARGSFDNSSVELLRDAITSFVPVDRDSAGYPAYGGGRTEASQNGSGVTIENQTIHVQVNGARDPLETGSELVQIMKTYYPGGGPIAIF